MEYEPDYIRELEKRRDATKAELDRMQQAKRDREVEIAKANEIKAARDLAAEVMSLSGETYKAEEERAKNELEWAKTVYAKKEEMLKWLGLLVWVAVPLIGVLVTTLLWRRSRSRLHKALGLAVGLVILLTPALISNGVKAH